MANLIQKFICISFLLIIFGCTPTYANAGVPMLIYIWPGLWLAFIPVVLIEAIVIRNYLGMDSMKKLIGPVSIANLFSTLIGIPVTWGALLALELLTPGGGGTYPSLTTFWRFLLGVTIQAPWLIPYNTELYWMIPVACMVLLVPFYFVSAWCEGIIFSRFLKGACPTDLAKKSMWKANLNSYGFLYMIVIVFFGVSLMNEISRLQSEVTELKAQKVPKVKVGQKRK